MRDYTDGISVQDNVSSSPNAKYNLTYFERLHALPAKVPGVNSPKKMSLQAMRPQVKLYGI